MSQPPAAVVRAARPEGDLQLYRLDRRVRFHCVQCEKDRKANLVATMGGDWERAVCLGCYSALVREQWKRAENAKKAEQDAREKAQEAAEARARMPGAYGLVEFLRAAGVDAGLVDGWLRIGREQVQRADHLLRPETFAWRKAVDKIVVEHVREAFRTAVEGNARFGNGLRVVPQWDKCGFSVVSDDVQLAVIHPTRAYTSDGKVLRAKVTIANFMAPGPHWQEVADALHRAAPGLACWTLDQTRDAPYAAARRQIDKLPDDLAPELTAACLDASERIRLERRMDYGDSPVVLQSDLGELRLLPVTGPESRLLVPFRLSRGKEAGILAGELVLGSRDPLPLLISETTTDEDVKLAWTCALLGFADATCIAFDPATPAARRESSRPRWHPRSSVSSSRSSAPALPGRLRWPGHLEPVGHTARYVNSLVRGHRRRLSGGREAGAEARDRARQIGISLRPDETWVQPYARGWPEGTEMRFVWHAPAELKPFLQEG